MESPDFQPSIAKKYVDQKFVLQASTFWETINCVQFGSKQLIMYMFGHSCWICLTLRTPENETFSKQRFTGFMENSLISEPTSGNIAFLFVSVN